MRFLLLSLVFSCSCCICVATDLGVNDQVSSAVVTQNVLLGPVAHYFRIEGVPRSVKQLSLLEIPFLTQNAYAQLWYRDDTITSNPLTSPKYQDFPFFVLYKQTSIQSAHSSEPIASRTRFAHTFLGGISIYNNDIWPGHTRTGIGNVFDDISILYSDRDENGKQDTAFVDLIAGALYRSRKTTDQNHWVWGELPLLTFVTYKKNKEQAVFTIIDSQSMQWTGLYTKTGPFFSLFRRHVRPDGQFTNEYLRLPLIGPVFASWHSYPPDGEYWKGTIFPRLFDRKHFNY